MLGRSDHRLSWGGGGHLQATGWGTNQRIDDLRQFLLVISYNDVTKLRRKMSRTRQQEDQEAEMGLDRFTVHLII